MNLLISQGVFIVLLILLERSEANTLNDLTVSYEVKMLQLANKHSQALEKLVTGYDAALDREQTKLQRGGRLDDVLKLTKEKQDLAKSPWPLQKLDQSSPAGLMKNRKLYETARIRIDRENATAIVEVATKMDSLLKIRMEILTKKGEIAQAKQAKLLREKISTDRKISDAKKFLERVRLDKNAPVAMRLRRSGDNLEVLVRFDKSGEVSLDSPVSNVVEITGGQKQKGDTKATVLGEFVGAKGYKVDPYIVFESDLDSELEPPMRVISLGVEPGFTHQKRKCLQIKMGPVAPNPRMEWPDLLEPVTNASRVKIDFAYFIPEKNKKLKAFAFHQGLLAPLDGQVMETQGRWVNHSIEADPINNNKNLRFYFENLSGGGKTFNGENEVVYLDDLKIYFINFSGHIVSQYKNGKPDGDLVAQPEKQKTVILLGKLNYQK